jgi:hypothetical protein
MNVVADFQADLGRGIVDIVRSAGFEVPVNCDTETACTMYANLMFRSIPPQPRAVLSSVELLGRKLQPDVAEAISKIAACSLSGGNLNPYLSTNLHDPAFQDPLFNEWRVHHLHLDLADGAPARVPGFVRRSGELLFAFVTSSKMLFLDVGRHGEWCDKRFVEILHANWPDEIAPWRCDDVSDADVLDHRWARRGGLTILTVLGDGR